NATTFQPLMRRLPPHARCIAVNARGYPPSDVPPAHAFSGRRAVEDLIDVADALGLKRAHWVGVSMGAGAVLQLDLQAPERVASLVLCSIGTGADLPRDEAAGRMEQLARR